MKAKGGTWTYDELFKFIKSPGAYVPGTKMSFAGLRSAQDRINLIAFLRTNTEPPVAIPAPAPAGGCAGRRRRRCCAGRSLGRCTAGRRCAATAAPPSAAPYEALNAGQGRCSCCRRPGPPSARTTFASTGL